MGRVIPYQLTANPYGFPGCAWICFAAHRNSGSSMWNAFPENGTRQRAVSPASTRRRRERRPLRNGSKGAGPAGVRVGVCRLRADFPTDAIYRQFSLKAGTRTLVFISLHSEVSDREVQGRPFASPRCATCPPPSRRS